MIIDIFTELDDNTKRTRHKIKFECDHCKEIYISGYSKRFLIQDRCHFCSKKCSGWAQKKGGKLHERSQESFKKTCQEHYGTDNPSQSHLIKKKCKKTCLDKYGVDHQFKSKEIQEKSRETCLKRYGVKHSFQSPLIKQKIKQTCLKRYGVENVQQSKDIQEKSRKTCLERYGVEKPLQSKEIQEKSRQTCMKNLNVEYPGQSNFVKEKSRQTCLNKYGVDHPWKSNDLREKYDQQLISEKRHHTMKCNGTYGKSKIEDQFYEVLCKKYGKENVERQVRINNWNIDFYIKSINTYIQFDGVYWHGLDRSTSVLKESKIQRDKIIRKTYLRDQKQNKWFLKNKLSLIRITDEDFLNSKSNKKCYI